MATQQEQQQQQQQQQDLDHDEKISAAAIVDRGDNIQSKIVVADVAKITTAPQLDKAMEEDSGMLLEDQEATTETKRKTMAASNLEYFDAAADGTNELQAVETSDDVAMGDCANTTSCMDVETTTKTVETTEKGSPDDGASGPTPESNHVREKITKYAEMKDMSNDADEEVNVNENDKAKEGEEDGGDASETNNEESQNLRRARNETFLHAGCGYSTKKKNLLKAFWEIVWSGLERLGWKKVDGKGKHEGSIHFFPPNVDVTKSWGKRNVGGYYNRIMAVIARVEERRNAEESQIADRFLEATLSDTIESSSLKPPRSSRRLGRPPRLASSIRHGHNAVDTSWKDGGVTYPKRSSQVGDEHQVVPQNIPPATSYEEEKSCPNDLYTQIWDPNVAAKEGMVQFLNVNVPRNKKEWALEVIHQNGYAQSSSLTEGIDKIRPTDGSDWSLEEKEKFRVEIFRHRKDLLAVSRSMGKSMGDILAYYFGKYKKSDDFRLLKTVLMSERMQKAASAAHEVDECPICGEGGGMLLICDGCEAELHMTCTKPALKAVPEGDWWCDMCVDRMLLEAQATALKRVTRKRSVREKEDTEKEDEKESSRKKALEAAKIFSTRIHQILSSTPKTPTETTQTEVAGVETETQKTR